MEKLISLYSMGRGPQNVQGTMGRGKEISLLSIIWMDFKWTSGYSFCATTL